MRELNKHYAKYFSLTPDAERSLATSLGITVMSLRKWMQRKREKEKAFVRTNTQLQTPYKPEDGMHVIGIYTYIHVYTLSFICSCNPNSFYIEQHFF